MATAQVAPSAVRPVARVTTRVDNAVTAKLAGSHPVAVDSAAVGPRLAAGTRLGHLHLYLTPTAEQDAALKSLADQQQDKSSPNFHVWLTPATFGQSFGAAASDIAQVTSWLQDQGLTIQSVAQSGRVITFAGTAGQVEAAFHTEMHTITVGGVSHVSNTTDISVPKALATVIGGIARLNDFFPRGGAHALGRTALAQVAGPNGTRIAVPNYGAATGTHYVAPLDVATIYNATPLTSAGIDGTGVTIAILAQSNINLADVEQFRSMFGLPKNDPTIIVVGTDPGTNQDDGEAYLDAEWSGAVATGAHVNFLVSSPDLEDGGVDDSGLYAVDNNIADIISLSYGGCEVSNGASATAFFNTLWEQAAAQGQTVFVSTGDSSADGCAASNSAYATSGYGVNALGSSAYNVAVGGTSFVDYGQATYWGATGGTTVPFANALSYIPEAPWNNSKLSTTYLNSGSTGLTTGSGIGGTGGGISIYTGRPSWQTGSGISASTDPNGVNGVVGIAQGSPVSGLHRLVPDVVNIAANNHDGALYCADSICALSGTSLYNAGVVGGTSVATPVQAGLQALINQKNGGRQGNANYFYYQLANQQYTASTTACQAKLGTAAAPAVTLPASTCNFHDVVGGSNAVPTSSTDTTGIGFASGVGYDAASGLGSINVTNMANNWSTVTFNSTATTLSLTPAAGIAHGTAQTINVTVTAGKGTPTGDFALIAQTASLSGPLQYTLTNGSFSGLVSSSNAPTTTGVTSALPAGNYMVYARYAGDGTFGASVSNAVPVSISKDTSNVSLNPYNVTTAGAVNSQTTFPYGANLFVDTYVTPGTGSGIPTGTVVYTVARGGTTIGTLTTNLDPQGNTYFQSGQSIPAFYLKANYPALAPGTYTLTAAYSGDGTFAASTNNVVLTITQLTPTVTFTAPANVNAGTAAVFGYSIANPSSNTYPNSTVLATGTVTFTDTTSATALGSCTLANAACSLSTTAIATAGANTISAVYTGDTNYALATNTATVTVGALTAPTVTVTSSGTLTVGATIKLIATLSPTTATGTVTFFNSGTLLGTANLASGVGSLSNVGTLPAGGLGITAVYSGSTTYSSNSGSATITVAKNSPSMTISSPLTSIYGQGVAIDINLVRSPTTSNQPAIQPTGTITFTDAGVTIGTGTPAYDAGGYYYYVSTLNIATLAAGSHTLAATYSGDGNFNTATSVSLTTTVSAVTPTITVSAPLTVYASPATIPLTAVIPLASNLAAPTAKVSFYAGTTLLGSSSLTYSAAAGGYVATYSATGVLGGPQSITAQYPGDTNYSTTTSAADLITVTTNNVWIANGNSSVSAVTESGTAVTSASVAGGGTAIAVDNAGDVWSLNKTTNSVAEFSNTGAVISSGYFGGGVNTPTALAIDGAGQVWVTNGNNTLSVLSPTGAPVSSTPYTSVISTPTSIDVDGSGNLWITNSGSNSVTQVIGVAAPVTTPSTTAVKNSSLASRP